ncbi:MAG TPA: NADH-quinone oxidoreductase subunit L, partial [Candidatus Methanomethylicus sp.]|nr:NADH-quinone oxidoreductase subunit L [Candidatus Methanomethylicus sp.]
MPLDSSIVPWLCWALPAVGSLAPLAIRGGSARAKGLPVVLLTFASMILALSLLPSMSDSGYSDVQAFWFSLPGGGNVGMGMLVDPLSVIIVNVVAFLCFMIMVYSLKYVEGDPSAGRYWFLMSLFVGGMLLLILADNLILFFIGWKLVGLCSYGLIGYYYRDEREHWIGGPAPYPFQKPSRAGLKALLVTTFGDVALLASVIIIYIYSGTFNFMELYQTSAAWLSQMAQTPGLLAVVSLLFVAGPLAKSAQFPFQEWLPDAMAGPTPVSALIHAATMVKAGVYLVARILPVFFVAYWVLSPGLSEALVFFYAIAAAGAVTIVLGATQAMVALELKKVLAYSTISAIGYMMLSLGVSGLSPASLVEGLYAGVYHLINHGVYKAALFLCAGIAIHASGSIYINEMGLSRRFMRPILVFMVIGGLALTGAPPLSGFWSKEGILMSCLESGQYLLFAVASVSVIVTMFSVIRVLGLMFDDRRHGAGSSVAAPASHESEDHGSKGHSGRAPALLLLPCGVLAALTLVISGVGPWLGGSLKGIFEDYLVETLDLPLSSMVPAHALSEEPSLSLILFAGSVVMIAIGALPAYRLYIQHKWSASELLARHRSLRAIHGLLWGRYYLDSIANRVFVGWTLAVRPTIAKYLEGTMDAAINVGIPSL